MEESSAKDKAPDPVAAVDFDDTITAEQDIFAATVVSTDPESDYWHWEGFIGGGNLAERQAGFCSPARCGRWRQASGFSERRRSRNTLGASVD